jgi:peptidoglycan/xylan/chitin deacetylase (PgdA/CDA1 family)
MSAEDPRELRRRQVRRRRAAAGGGAAAVLLILLLALGVSGGGRVKGSGEAEARTTVVPDAVADARVRHLAKFGSPVYCGGRNRPYVALTFDGGPGPFTRLALRELAAVRAPSTFFLLGRNVAANRTTVELLARFAAVGDLTFNNAQLTAIALVDARNEIASAAKAITAVTHQPVRLIRPPNGFRNPGVDAVARAEGMLEVLWDVDAHDELGASSDAVIGAVTKGLRPGSIVRMHENAGQTVIAIRGIAAELRRRHLRAVTVPELMAVDPPSAAQLAAGPKGCGIPDPQAGGLTGP